MVTLALAVTGRDTFAQVVPSAGAGGAFEGGAPGPGGGPGGLVGPQGGVNPVMILLAPAVQTELKLDEGQKTKVFELARDAARRSREMIQSRMFNGGSNPQALFAAGARLRQENDRAAAAILKPEQKERVDQIVLQAEGPLAVFRQEVASKLGLSPVQNRQIQATVFQMVQAGAMLQAGAGGVPGQGMDRSGRARLRDAAGQQIGRILTAKQRDAFNKMRGEPFDLSKIDPELARPAAAPNPGEPQPGDSEKARPRRKRAPATKRTPAKDADKP
jgi:hypothetical protein